MAGPHATRNNDLIALAKVWRSQTGSLMGRSSELEKIDKALRDFERLGNLGAVQEAFAAWKAKYATTGERWQDSHRNKNAHRPFERLEAILSGSGDSDKAFGNTPDFMHASHVNARQGILYLFGHMEVETSVAAVILRRVLLVIVVYHAPKIDYRHACVHTLPRAISQQLQPFVILIAAFAH